jgi:hypothetical protein
MMLAVMMSARPYDRWRQLLWFAASAGIASIVQPDAGMGRGDLSANVPHRGERPRSGHGGYAAVFRMR